MKIIFFLGIGVILGSIAAEFYTKGITARNILLAIGSLMVFVSAIFLETL